MRFPQNIAQTFPAERHTLEGCRASEPPHRALTPKDACYFTALLHIDRHP